MRFNTKFLIAFTSLFVITANVALAGSLRENALRQAAISNGFVPASKTWVEVDREMVSVGKLLFESLLLSTDQTTSCATCHIDEFGSADGTPIASGVGGKGLSSNRTGGRAIPRNTLPLWGRGGKGFDTFFWDGKVQKVGEHVESQFGKNSPSNDALVVAVHLPPVELREMVGEIANLDKLQTEDVASAQILYDELVSRIKVDQQLGPALSNSLGKTISNLKFLDIATAISEFIRFNFAVSDTKFHDFVFQNRKMSDNEIAGGLLFYGKGRCVMCHNGPYFSDLKFHSIPSPTHGFGKNGFGVDYGRFNVTLNPKDGGLFRTPPLYNVIDTAPYMHSGSVLNLEDAIRAHRDPIAVFAKEFQSVVQRMEFYRQLKFWSHEPVGDGVLSQTEIDNLIVFLKALKYTSKTKIRSQ